MDISVKAGWVGTIFHREMIGDVKNVTVTRGGGAWHVSIMVEREIDQPAERVGEVVGADAGMTVSWTLSTGEVHQLPKVSPEEMKKLAVLQQRLPRKTKGSLKRRQGRQAEDDHAYRQGSSDPGC